MFKCPHCGTEENKKGEPFTNQGSLNLHIRSCSEKEHVSRETIEDDEMIQDEKPEPKYKGKLCPDCGKKLKLLNPNVEWCKKPLAEGFEKVCMPCKKVY